METKRMLLAVVLSMAVLMAFQYFGPKRPAPPPQEAARTADNGGSGVATVPPDQPTVVGAVSAPGEVVAPDTRARVENDRMVVELSSRGAAVVSATLKQYRDKAGRDGKPLTLLGAASGFDAAGDARLTGGALAPGVAYREVERRADRVAYAWDSATGLHVEKIYSLSAGRYDVGLTVRVRNGTTAVLKDHLGLALIQDFSAGEDRYTFTGPTYLRGDDLVQIKLKELKKEPKVESGDIPWAAMLEKYFLVAAVPDKSAGNSVRADRYRGQEKVVLLETVGPEFELNPGAEATFGYRIYLGPKEADALDSMGAKLGRVIYYGWFTVIARPLLAFLKAIYRFTGNYGIAIIVLTTLVKGVFWPLSAKSFRSMQKMKDLQPKMQKLKERYSKDRERLNMEVMQLYKTHKVNPLSGCLPMFVQIPVFFALYRVLLSSIELRQAPFFLWIVDLSAKDPLYVTPLVMGASMFLQQRMTPAAGVDPVQAKMMQYGMPALFTFMFLNFPSGLVLYWLVNNLLSIAQQGLMIRQAKTEAA